MSTFSPSITSAEIQILSKFPKAEWGICNANGPKQLISTSTFKRLYQAELFNDFIGHIINELIPRDTFAENKIFKLKRVEDSGYIVTVPREIIQQAFQNQNTTSVVDETQIIPANSTLAIAETERHPFDIDDHPLNMLNHWRVTDPAYVKQSFVKQLDRAKMMHGPKESDPKEWKEVRPLVARILTGPASVGPYRSEFATSLGGAKRLFNEDLAYNALDELQLGKEKVFVQFAGIFDGHSKARGAGKKHAQYLEEHFLREFEMILDAEYLLLSEEQKISPEWIDLAIFNAFKLSFVNISKGSFNHLVAQGIAGTTATIAMIFRGHLYTACTGDSRAIYVSEDEIIPLSWDAKVHDPNLQPNIDKDLNLTLINRGTYIVPVRNGFRTECELNITHALGHETEHGINSRPKITKVPLSDKPSWVIVASDGLWDVATSSLVGKTFLNRKGKIENSEIAKELIHKAVNAGSSDNITVLILDLIPKKTNDDSSTLTDNI